MVPVYNLWAVVFALFISLIIVGFLIKEKSRRVLIKKKLSELALFFGSFAFLWGILGSILGYFQAIDAIEQASDISIHIMGSGFKVATLPALYGLGLFVISFVVWYALGFIRKRDKSNIIQN